jgi:hypothetical protein
MLQLLLCCCYASPLPPAPWPRISAAATVVFVWGRGAAARDQTSTWAPSKAHTCATSCGVSVAVAVHVLAASDDTGPLVLCPCATTGLTSPACCNCCAAVAVVGIVYTRAIISTASLHVTK